jgi:hypothetical protein
MALAWWQAIFKTYHLIQLVRKPIGLLSFVIYQDSECRTLLQPVRNRGPIFCGQHLSRSASSLLGYEFSIEGIHPGAKMTNGEAHSVRPIDDAMAGDMSMNFDVH